MSEKEAKFPRRSLVGGLAAVGVLGALVALRRKVVNRLANWTQKESFAATPPLVPHDAETDATKIFVAQGGEPAANIDEVLKKLGGVEAVVGKRDLVIIKVSAQWWNQGMTNVAAVKRTIEHILDRPGFEGEVVVFENTHFIKDGSGLSRAWLAESERNVDVEGWKGLGDLMPHFEAKPVSFVGLIDGGESMLADDDWHDPERRYGIYGGDGKGPIEPGEDRDGYFWDRDDVFALERSWFDEARTPLTWPRFTSPHSGLVIDLRDGVFERKDGKLASVDRRLTWINMTTCNEHGATGLTAACKSTMGVVDMSAGVMGTHPIAQDYRAVHYFGMGAPGALWRMAGPLAHFASEVRAPDLILTVAEWVAFTPKQDAAEDIRHAEAAAMQKKTVVAGTDPVAIDTWICRNLMKDVPSRHHRERLDMDNEDAMVVKFLRYYREVRGRGTLDEKLIDVA